MKGNLITIGRKIMIIFCYTLPLVFYASAAYAAPPELITGFMNLINDATSWVLGLIPGTATIMIGYHYLMKSAAEGDPTEVVSHNRAIINVLKAGAIGTGAVGLVKTILSYFQ